MRDLGTGEGPVTWVEASAPSQRPQRKQKLEDALRRIDLESEGGQFADAQSVGMQSSVARSLLPEEVLPSEFVRKRTYQDQQDVPDEIAGMQPDMDPELREALRALDDEEFVDDVDEENIFGRLVEAGVEIDKDEFERLGEQDLFEEGEGVLDEDDGWESDDTIKARDQSPPPELIPTQTPSESIPDDPHEQPPADPTSGAWLDEYKKFKTAAKSSQNPAGTQPPLAMGPRDASTILSTASSRRSEHQQVLDARFERLMAKEYADEDGQFDDVLSNASGLTGMSKASGISKASGYSISSSASQSMRSDFDGIIDEFLGTHSRVGKRGKRVARLRPRTGMEQLDEIRQGLGPARVKSAGRSNG
jgi:protein LTV1